MTRIAILKPEEMNDEQRTVIESSKTKGRPHGGPLAYICNSKLMQSVQKTAACIADTRLSSREQQIVTLTVARFWGREIPVGGAVPQRS